SDPEFFKTMGNFDAVEVKLNQGNGDLSPNLVYQDEDVSKGIDLTQRSTTRKNRERRNQYTRFLTTDEAQLFALENTPKFYEPDSESAKGFNRSEHPGHHVSEISVLREDGMRYYYGIPAYNNTQQEVTFAVNKPTDYNTVCKTGVISYTQQDASKDNGNGLDNYFQKTELPAYSHSYLLTAIVSADYVDKTGDGPSDDDLGTYTRFFYTRMYTDFQWRTPFADANYNEGLKSNPLDDKANFVKGSKEIWYLKSIETRTHVAVLELEDREDGYGSKESINGGQVSNEIDRDRPLKLLRKISLYTKPDRDNELKFPNDPSKKAFPIKVVHFEYDYSLCPGVANNLALQSQDLGSGKLTLKQVYFTFGNSKKGKMSPYVFHYADNDHKGDQEMNFGYELKAHDRWGNYKAPGNCNETAEFPYVEQRDSVLATQYAAAWSLTSIDLPSGATIEVTYESDDYAYVQNKRAMQMFRITGSGNAKTDNPTSGNGINENSFFFFELNRPIPANDPAAAKKILSDEYFSAADGTPIQFMYFKFLAQMGAGGNDYVPGYSEIESFDVAAIQPGDTEHRYAYVRMKPSSNHLSPVTKSSIQFARVNNPRLAYSNSGHMEDPPNEISVQSLGDMFSRLGKGIQDAFQGIEDRMKGEDFGTHFMQNQSFVRLYHPAYKKMGGGLRVKKITSTDHWKEMTEESDYEDMVYGQEYSYSKIDERGLLISSGVASYEPLLGGDENPFRQPDVYDVKRTWAPSDEYYQEQPYGESWFPGPQVGYSEVTVKNIKPEGFENKITKTATGKTVHQFYTAQDFPTLTKKTLLNPRIETPSGLSLGLIISAKSTMTGSQGYVVELNDMHGKTKSTKVYPEDSDVPISEVSYIYQTQQQAGQPIQLDNTVQVADEAGNIKDALMGVDYEMVVDSRRSHTTATTVGASINVNSFIVGIIPIMLAAVYPENKISESTFKSVAVTKIIQRMGILKRVVVRDLGSEVSTDNLLYNEDTGHVLLTKTTDEFDDAIYNFTYPAHWAFKGMGAAYHNTDLVLKDVKLSEVLNTNFQPGDELAITPNGPQAMPFKAWVIDIPGGTTGITVQRLDKTPLDGNTTYKQIKVLRSGKRNQQALSMGSLTSTVDPRSGNKLILSSSAGIGYSEFVNSILNTSAIVFDSKWEISCNCEGNNFSDVNPYVNGQKGNFRPAGNYVYIVDRKQSTLNNNTNIRKDGVFAKYTPFWTYNGVSWIDQHTIDRRWVLQNQVTYYGSKGQELENRDALQRYSSALYGFRETLPTAVSSNAALREIGFESFEDYEFSDCAKDKFSFQKDANGNTTTTSGRESHTGKFSLEIPANTELKIVKPLKLCPPKPIPEPVVK
ncbi:MAG: hypothetical protein JWM14_3199, partial [Chitinophagaceae bacterium]|nr:hypothetical protein [Chitinophagaceae bacterium]